MMSFRDRASGSVGQIFSWIFRLGVGFAILLSLAGYLGGFHLAFELMSHFKVQYAIAGICAFIYFTIRRDLPWILVSLFCIVINWVEIVPWYLPDRAVRAENPTPLRVLVSNVNKANRNFDAAIEWIQSENPDIVAVLEVDRAWQEALEKIRDRLPHMLFEPRNDNFGIALYSNLPLDEAKIEFLGHPKIPTIVANLDKGDRQFTVIATHPVPPLNGTFLNLRNGQLEAIAEIVPTFSEPVILLGDLNITMWSPIYKNTLEKTGLRNSRRGFGILPTWPVNFPLLSIPIDHVLVSPEIEVLEMRRGPDVGSDHLAIAADLALP